jgi:hypothetical protein
MRTTLWVMGMSASIDGNDCDHSAMFEGADQLDGLCERLKVPRLSSFFDWADFNADAREDEGEEPLTWFDPGQALPSLQALRSHFLANPVESAPGLVEELQDCIRQVSALAERSEPFHLRVARSEPGP